MSLCHFSNDAGFYILDCLSDPVGTVTAIAPVRGQAGLLGNVPYLTNFS